MEKSARSLLKQIAEPLDLGEQGETHFVLSQRWKDHFTRKATESGSSMTVQALRRWVDEPKPRGLPTECENLIVLIFAAQTNRSFFRHGAPYDVTLASLPDDVELREQKLPSEGDWVVAVERAGRIFGVTSSPLRNATNLAKLADAIQTKAGEHLESCRRLVIELSNTLTDFGQKKEGAPRWQTAQAVEEMLDAVRTGAPAAVVESIASLTPETSEAAMGTSLTSSGEVVTALATAQWKLFESIQALTDDRATAAKALLGRVKEALSSDQHVKPLGPVLNAEQVKAIDLLTPPKTGTAGDGKKQDDGKQPPLIPVAKPGKKVVESSAAQGLTLDAASEKLAELKRKAKPSQTIRINVAWVIEE